MILEPYQQRVISERKELDDRLNKLTTFLTTVMVAPAEKGREEEQDLLLKQAAAMITYLGILDERIKLFWPGEQP